MRERSEDRGDPLCPLSVKYLNVAFLSFVALNRSIEPENDWSTNISLPDVDVNVRRRTMTSVSL